MPLSLYIRKKSPQYLLDKRLGGPQGTRLDAVEEKISYPYRKSNPGI
jgi:hypothetical protein